MIKKGDMLMLQIEDTNLMGRGVAKCEGLVIFCDGAVKGDTVISFITDVKKTWAEAKALKVSVPSPERRESLCPNFEKCGGCGLGHVTYDHETEVKKAGIEASFRRCGDFHGQVSEMITTSPEGYRNKSVFHFDSEKSAGFFSHGTRDYHAVDACEICHPEIIRIKGECEKLLKSDESIRPEELTYLYIRHMETTGESSVVLGYTGKSSLNNFAESLAKNLPSVKCVMRGTANSPEARNEKFALLFGKDRIRDIFCGMELEVSPASFYQVNHDAAEKMCGLISDLAELKPDDVCLDLYCGIGTIGLTVAKAYSDAKIYGIEINPQAASDAEKNAKANGISNAKFFSGDSRDFADKTGVQKADCIIVDPPRAGLSDKTIEEVLKFSPEKIIYVSCNPSTLSRDLKKFLSDYEMTKAIGVNMFPRTLHVESVILLTKTGHGV